jgi:uncharacterized protein YjbI with pentapeptide repeats
MVNIRRSLTGFQRRHGGEMLIAVLATLLAAGLTTYLESRFTQRQEQFADSLADRQEIAENLRFVRDRASTNQPKPFLELNLAGVTLRALDLSCEAPLSDDCASFGGANLRDADLVLAKLHGASFNGADMRDAQLDDADLSDTEFLSSDLRGASFEYAVLADAVLNDAQLDNARLSSSYIDGAVFSRADLTNAEVHLAMVIEANFNEAKLSGASFEGSVLDGSDFSEADLTGADFQGACYNPATTQWPANFMPPPSAPDGCPWAGQR